MSNIDEIRKRDREAIPRLGPAGDPLLRAEMDRRWLLAEFEKARALGDRHLMESERQQERAEKAEVERDKWEKSAGIWETEAVDLLQDRTRAEAKVADLQRQLAEAVGQTEAAKQATREIMAERNTWARQLADMRDERETARTEASTQRDRYISTSVDQDNLVVEIERLIETWEQHPDRSGNDLNLSAATTEIRVKELRRALAQWINI